MIVLTSARSTISFKPPANAFTSLSIRTFHSSWNRSRASTSGFDDGPAVSFGWVSNLDEEVGGGRRRPKVDEGSDEE